MINVAVSPVPSSSYSRSTTSSDCCEAVSPTTSCRRPRPRCTAPSWPASTPSGRRRWSSACRRVSTACDGTATSRSSLTRRRPSTWRRAVRATCTPPTRSSTPSRTASRSAAAQTSFGPGSTGSWSDYAASPFCRISTYAGGGPSARRSNSGRRHDPAPTTASCRQTAADTEIDTRTGQVITQAAVAAQYSNMPC